MCVCGGGGLVEEAYNSRNSRRAKDIARDARLRRIEHGEIPLCQTAIGDSQLEYGAYVEIERPDSKPPKSAEPDPTSPNVEKVAKPMEKWMDGRQMDALFRIEMGTWHAS